MPALEQRDVHRPREPAREGARHQRQVARHDLPLQRERGRRDDDPLVLRHGVPDRGHEVPERLAGARAGLHEEVLTARERVGHGVRHGALPLAPAAAEGTDREVE